MELINEALEFEKAKMRNMSTSDRVVASREAKRLILALNEIYKKSKDTKLMDIMKLLTAKKRKIEKRLKGRPDPDFQIIFHKRVKFGKSKTYITSQIYKELNKYVVLSYLL